MLPNLDAESTAKLQLALASNLFGPVAEARIRAILAARERQEGPSPTTPSRPARAGAAHQEEAARPGVLAALQAPAEPPSPTRRGVKNKTEARYLADVLQPLIGAGALVRAEFEAITFHVHGGTRYTPDYVAWCPDGLMWCHEVKGGLIRPEDRDRFKAHSVARAWIRWTMAQWEGGVWRVVYDVRPTPTAG